jgi:lysophospholipase L1-like esterase
MGRVKRVGRLAFVTALVLAALEGLVGVTFNVRNAFVTHVPLPYVIGHEYGPTPPWLEELLILAPDSSLIWRNRPNLSRRYVDIFRPMRSDDERRALFRAFLPPSAESWKDYPVWEIRLNDEGYRVRGPLGPKRPSSVRIVCLGDSWTFGMNVNDDDTYPARLERLLRREFPGLDVEVLNLGVLAYSSHQGLALMKSRVLGLEPDLVLLGFAMNDAKVAGYRDKDRAVYKAQASVRKSVDDLVARSAALRLLRYLAMIVRDRPQTIGYYLQHEAEVAAVASGGRRFDELEPWTRVSLTDYERNMREMVRLVRIRDAEVVLLYNELWENGPYRDVLKRLAAEEKVPFLDSNAVILGARRKVEAELEKTLGLVPKDEPGGTEDEVEVVFRIHVETLPVPKALYIVGPYPQLGSLVPNKVAMYDDGTHGDQRAGDGVWTYAARFRPGTTVYHVYTNSGAEGQWEGLDVPHIREFTVDARPTGQRLYPPIESFGKIYLQADSWHPDGIGYRLIAEAMLQVLQRNETFRQRAMRANPIAARHSG